MNSVAAPGAQLSTSVSFAPPRSNRENGCAGSVTVTLAAWQGAVLATEGPALVRCLWGQVWLTRSSDNEDTILRPGEQHLVSGAKQTTYLSTADIGRPVGIEVLPLADGGLARKRAWLPSRPYIRLRVI